MSAEKMAVGIFLAIVGTFFFLNSKNVSEGAFKWYRILYTKKNLRIMFRALGIFLALAGLAIAFVN